MPPSAENTAGLPRSRFSSRFGFIMAATGSAVGIGNIWGFPTQVADNGGAAFLLVYLLLSLLLAYPALVAELLIGRYGQANPITTLKNLPEKRIWTKAGWVLGIVAVLTVCLIFSFYSIIGGWLIGYGLSPLLDAAGLPAAAEWLHGFSTDRNLILTLFYIAITLTVVSGGVQQGIEKWSTRLMPALIILLLILIGLVLSREGAINGLRHYLIPDFSLITPKLVINALGQSFFSMSLGVGVMMVYGSYLSRQTNLPKVALQVCLIDTGIAVLAGLLIIPALYVALEQGVTIYTGHGHLVSSDTLVFHVLPSFFDTLGTMGLFVSSAFFLLMTIAALTSSISMLEVPVNCLIERGKISRSKACVLVCIGIAAASSLIIIDFRNLFDSAVTLSTRYSQPLCSLLFCIYAGWLLNRNRRLAEIRQGFPDIEQSLFWKIWPWYVRLACPALIVIIIIMGLE